MANIFSPQEILRIAIRVEENGRNLYEALEKKAKDKKLIDTWRYLKEQEELHRKIFKEMLDKVGDYLVVEFSPGEYEAYIRAIASEYIFTQELIDKKTKELFKSDLEAVEFGIYVEKESILIYTALRQYILSAKQAVIDKVIEEEQRHLVQLIALRETLR